MSEPSITDEEINDLCDRLSDLELSYAQRTLLDGILKIAWEATAAAEALESGFDRCFEPSQAALLISYQSGSATSVEMIGRSVTDSATNSTFMISRGIGR